MSSGDQEILDLFQEWNGALQTRDAKQVVNLYAENGVLIPTMSNDIRTTHAEIFDYFDVKFLPNLPVGTLREYYIRRFGDMAINSGLYSFKMGLTGETVEARFTFVYRNTDGRWLIVEHHSSALHVEVAKVEQSALMAF